MSKIEKAPGPSSPKTLAEAARISPTAVFDAPVDVVQAEDLTKKEKVDILGQWEADAKSLQTAMDEGMSGGKRPNLDLVKTAQSELEAKPQQSHLTVNLPESIAAYIDASNAHDARGCVACFTQNAVVRDEKREYRGLAAILAWKQETIHKYKPTIDVLEISDTNGKAIVTCSVAGNFPGSPADLRYAFTLEGRKVLQPGDHTLIAVIVVKNGIRDQWRHPGESNLLHLLVLCEARFALRRTSAFPPDDASGQRRDLPLADQKGSVQFLRRLRLLHLQRQSGPQTCRQLGTAKHAASVSTRGCSTISVRQALRSK